MNEFEQLVISSFATHKWRITSGVRNLTDILGVAPAPLSVQEIDVILGKGERNIDATTIYRILEKFLEAGILHNLRGRFIRCNAPHETKKQHHFLMCEKCGRAEEIFLDYQGSIEKQLAQEKNFILREVEMYFWGTCGHCSR